VVWGRSSHLLSSEFDPHSGLHAYSSSAGVAKLANAADLESAGPPLDKESGPCEFNPRRPHHTLVRLIPLRINSKFFLA
jgi:hypothetical protein